MNSDLRDKLRKLTMFYNSADFKAMKPGKEKDKHTKRKEELEYLFFDKDHPLDLLKIYKRLENNSQTSDEIAKKIESIEEDIEGAKGMANWIPDWLEQGKFDKWNAEIATLKSLDEHCCEINFAESNEGHEDLIQEILGPCFSPVGTNDILLPRENLIKDKLLLAQINSDITSPLSRNAGLLDCYLNYIPNIERSKCTPFLKVSFFTKKYSPSIKLITEKVKKKDKVVGWEGNDEQLAVFNFLNGSNASAELGSADFLMLRGSQRDLPTRQGENGEPIYSSVTSHGMETFTLPQTVKGASNNPLVDPFRPLMSLDSANIHIYPAGEGAISFKRATIKFTLFDRTRLRDVSFLLDPSRFGSTVIEIEAGWQHPDPSTAYGAILSAMRVKDLYQISKADFSMKDASTFNISIDVAMLGGQSIFHENIFTASAAAQRIREWNKMNRRIASEYRDIARALGKDFTIDGNVLPQSIVSKKGNEDAVATFNVSMDELVERLNDLKAAVQALNSDDDASNDVPQDTIRAIDQFLHSFAVDQIQNVPDAIEALKNEFVELLNNPGDSQDPYLVAPYDGGVEVVTSEGTEGIDRQVGIIPAPLTLPGDSTWRYQWNTVEAVTGSPPPAEARPGDPPHPEDEESRPTDPQSPYPHYWWARRNVATDSKVDIAGNDVWENLWTARFPTLNNELAYQILNEAFPIVPGTPPEVEPAAETEYISFGKLFLNLAAYPCISRSEAIDEVHVITYNFNKYAAGLGYKSTDGADQRRNIASFALKKKDVEIEMTRHLEKKYDIMPADIINFARKAMKNKFNEQFGIVPVDEDGRYTDDVAASKQQAQTLTEQISSLKKQKAAFQSSDPTNEETYVDPADLPGKQAEIDASITTAEAELVAVQEEMAELIKDGEEAAKANLGVSKLKMPALKMFVETVKKGEKYIVRFHVYDANEKPYEVQEAAANMIELLDSAVNEKDEKSKQMYDALKNTPGALVTIPSRRPGTPSRTVLNHRSLAIKSAIKANMPSITYGTEATAINSISLNTVSDNNINTHFLLETRKAEQDDPSDDSGAADSPPPSDAEAQKIFPVTLSLDMLGCPVIDFAQQIFIDIGTRTDLDNVYAAIDVQHNLKPGSFTTTAKMSPTFSGESVTFGDLVNDVIAKHDKVAVNAGVEEDESTD